MELVSAENSKRNKFIDNMYGIESSLKSCFGTRRLSSSRRILWQVTKSAQIVGTLVTVEGDLLRVEPE